MKKSDSKKMFPSVISARLFSVLMVALLFAGVLPDSSISAEGDPLQSYPYQHVLADRQHAKSVVVDPAGYVIIGGSTLDDFLTVKVKADGSGKLWEKTFDQGSGLDHLEAVAIDSNGDVIVTGYASEGVNGLMDIITIKYDGVDGTVHWQETYNNTDNDGNDLPFALAVDSLNNIYVAGKTQGSGGDDDGLLLKYSPDGANPDGTPIWVTTYDGSGAALNDQWSSVAAGTTGVAVTGKTDSGGADFNIVTMLYNLDGTNGWLTPVVHDSGFIADNGLLVAMDSNNDVVITGVSGTNGGDFYTVKYSNADGSIDAGWVTAKTYDGGSVDQPRGLWIDGNDDVYVTGSTFIGASTDYYTIRYSGSDGSSVWGAGAVFNSGLDQSDIPVGIVVDDTGDVFVTGYSVLSGTDYDFTTLKYKKDNGNQLWIPPVGVYSGAAGKQDQPLGLGLSSSGELFVGGWTDTATNDYDFIAIKYDPGNLNSPTDLIATTISNTAVDLAWTRNSSNESGFTIFRKKAADPDFTEIDTVPAGTTSYSDTGLTAHIWYTYKVQAYITSPAAVSHFSNEANALTTAVSYDTPTWSFLYNSADNGEDYAYAIAIGPDEDPVATGTHQPGISPAPVSFDYYTVKMNHTDAAGIWEASYNNADDQLDIANCITVDNNNDVLVSGFSNLPWGLNPNTNDIYTRKYLSTGPDNGPPNFGDPFIWSAQYNGPGNDDDRSEAIDASSDGDNNVVVTGYGKNGRGEDDIYVIKYDAPGDGLGAGNMLWEATPYDGGGNDYPYAVTFDQNGDVFVTGQSFLGGNEDIFTRKIAGTDGSTMWTAIYNGTGNGYDAGYSMALDSNGDVWVTGSTTNGAGNLDWYIVKYDGDTSDPNGTVLWSTTHDGPANGDDMPESIRVDQNDDAVVIGGTVLQSAGNNDFHVRRYTSDGTPDWDRTLERVGNDDNATTMGMDVSGNVCLAGNTDDADSIDLLAVKYDYAGNILGSTLYDGVDDTDAHDMAVNTLGDQFIAGYTTPRVNLDSDFLVVKCMGDVLQSPSPVTTIVHYTSVDLNWVDNTSDEDGFYLERKVGDCASVDWNVGSNLIHTAAAGSINHTDEGLNIGSTYCYRIQTFKNSGATSRWIEKEVTTTTPLPPDGLSALVLNTTDIKLEWNDTTSTEDGFTIERCTGPGCDPAVGPDKKVFDVPADSESFVDTTGCYGITYNYHIKAYRTGKWSTLYVDFAADLTTANLAPPTLLVKKDFVQNTIYLEWNDNSNDETSFVIQRCTTSGCSDFADIDTVTTVYGNVLLLGMNESSWAGSPATDEAVDDSGNGNHGTAFGDANTGAEGVYGRRAELDGNGDYLTTALSIDQSAASTGATMMAWVYPTSTSSGNHYIFSTENGSTGSENFNWGVYRNGGTWYVDTGSGGVSTGVAVAAGQWQHIAVAFDPAGIRFYKDGVETAMAIPGNNDTSYPFTIGRNGVQNNEYFDGYLDEVAVYDRSLNQAQVQTLIDNSVFENGKARYADSAGITYQNFYTYRIRAEKTTDPSCTWDPVPSNELEINTLPPPPTDLQATTLDSTRVWLSWTDTTAGEDTFTLERCEIASCTYATVSDTIPANTTSYVDKSACGAVDYRYRIKAVKNAVWTSLASNTADATTLARGEAVTVFTMTGKFEEQVDFEWNYANTDLTGFRVGVCQGAPDPSAACSVDADYGYTGSPYISGSVLPDGALGWWKFDEPLYDGTASEVVDSTGSGNHGTTINNPTNAIPGKYGYGALEFDGVDDYITTPLNIDQDSAASNGATFEAWVNSNASSTGWRTVIATENGGNDWGIMQNGNNWYVSTGENWRYVTNGANSGWQHIAAVFTPGVGTMFYKNGVEYSVPYIAYDISDNNLTIGRYGANNNYYFWGSIDEVAVYDRALSQQEIVDRFNQTVRYSVNGLSSATEYNFTIWAYKSETCGWDGPRSSVISTTTEDITAISPTNFRHTFFNTTQVDLAWDDIASSETGYRLQRCLGDQATCEAGFVIDDAGAADWLLANSSRSYSDDTACQGQTYTYRVRAEGTVGGDSLWAYHEVTTAPATEPGITLDVISESEINITWGDFTPDEEQFTLRRCLGSGTACDGIPVVNDEFTLLLATEAGSIPGVSSIHYRMDEAAWANGASDVVDISGNNYHGQPYNSATTIAAGKYDRAGEFNGTNQYIDTPLNIDQSDTSNGVTFEAWVYPTVSNGTWKYLISTENAPSSGYDWSIFYLNSTWYVTNGITTWNAGSVTFLDWQHIAVVFEPGVGVRFYKNGVENSSTQIGYDTSDANVTIGRRGSLSQQYFQGNIDEVIIYERPLTAGEVTEHYTNQAALYGFADSGLTAGTEYTYRIQAEKSVPGCNWITATIDTATTMAPPPPTDLAVGGDTTTAALVWNDNSGSETGYRVQRCTGDSGSCNPAAADAAAEWATEWVLAADAETYDDTTVCPGQTFSYRVRAEQSPGWGSTTWDSVVGKVIPTPTPPSGLNFTKISEVQVNLGWNDETTDESGFTIEQCAGASCPATGVKNELTVNPDAETYQAIELTPDQPYTFRIRADKASALCGWPTAYSAEVSTDTVPFVPLTLSGSSSDTTTIDLVWTGSTASETGTAIVRCDDPPACSGGYATVGTAGPGETSFSDTTVCNDSTYNYQIKAVGEGLSNGDGGCWTKKAPVNFTGFQANTAVQFTIPYASFAPDMQSDFSDIRFFDTVAKQELTSFWFADKQDGVTATVWLVTGNNDAIYMYYGNASGLDSSAGDSLFTRTYDLSGTVIRSDDWVEIEQPATNLITQNNGISFVYSSSYRAYNKGLVSTDAFGRGAGNEMYIDLTTGYYSGSGGFYAAFGWAKDQSADPGTSQMMHGLEFYGTNRYHARFRIYENGTAVNIPDPYRRYSENTRYELKIVLKEPGAQYYVKGGVYEDWTLLHETSTDFTGDETLRAALLHHSQRLTINAVTVKHASNQFGINVGAVSDVATCTGDFNTWESQYNDNGPVTIVSDDFVDPDGLTLTVTSDTSVDLSWNSGTTDESGFKVERCLDTGSGCTFVQIDTTGAGVTTYSDITVPPSATVSYQVKAYKTTPYCSWTSGPSNAPSVVIAASEPTGPDTSSVLNVTALNSFRLQLDWIDNGTDEEGYEVEVKTFIGNYANIAVLDANTETYVDGKVEPDKTYYYRVRSYRGNAKSGWLYGSGTTPPWVEGDSTNSCDP